MSRAPGLVRRLIIIILAVLILCAITVLVAVLTIRRIPRQQLTEDLFVLEDRGGNTTVLTTSEGALVVDTKFWRFSERLLEELRDLTDKPVRYVVNTHYHWDHTHGNTLFSPEVTVVATARTLAHMTQRDPHFQAAEHKRGLPADAFEEVDHHLKIGGQLVHVVRVGRGHTDGDCVVYFPQQRVVATGDLFFNGYYPIVDHDAGGSLIEWIDTVDRVLALGPSYVVPGHGRVAEPAELKAFQGYLRDLITAVAKLRDAGKSRDEVIRDLRLPIHEARMKDLYSYSSLAMNAGAAFDELERGGKVPEERTPPGVEALEGEPEGQDPDAAGEEPVAE